MVSGIHEALIWISRSFELIWLVEDALSARVAEIRWPWARNGIWSTFKSGEARLGIQLEISLGASELRLLSAPKLWDDRLVWGGSWRESKNRRCIETGTWSLEANTLFALKMSKRCKCRYSFGGGWKFLVSRPGLICPIEGLLDERSLYLLADFEAFDRFQNVFERHSSLSESGRGCLLPKGISHLPGIFHVIYCSQPPWSPVLKLQRTLKNTFSHIGNCTKQKRQAF
jgi:hypothetical protein